MFSPQPGPRHAGRSASQFYHRVGIESLVAGSNDAHRLVGMLFDGFFEALAQARGALLAGQTEVKGRAIGHAMRIVDEGLKASLNLNEGGALAADLDALYAYVCQRLLRTQVSNDAAALDECRRLMQPLREAWASIGPQSSQAA
jgi:flagellar secretion chaperone FliS